MQCGHQKDEARGSEVKHGSIPWLLFPKMDDGCYKQMKKFLHEAFLVEKQQHPRDVLRFMANFIGTDTGKP